MFVDLSGKQVGQKETIDVSAGPVNDFGVFPNGDIAWAYAWDDLNKLKIIRIGQESSPPPPPTAYTNIIGLIELLLF